MTVTQLRELADGLRLASLFQDDRRAAKCRRERDQPGLFKAMNQQLTSVPIADWQTYLRWHLINNTAQQLSAKFVDEDFNFKGKVLQGSKENLPRWKRCVAGTDRVLGEALGEVYVKKAFPPAAKARALEMVRNLEAALKTDITTAELDERTHPQTSHRQARCFSQ